MFQSIHRRHATLNHLLEQHGNVEITSVVDGHVLTYESATETWKNAAPTATLSGLTDTDISSPAEGEILVYDGSDSWDNQSASTVAYPPQLGHLGI